MAQIEYIAFTLTNGQSVEIKSLISSDAKAYLEFSTQIAEETTHTMRYAGMSLSSIDETAEHLQKTLNHKIILNIGVFDKDKMIGYLNFRPVHSDHPWVKHSARFAMMILKDYWGQGIGQKLLKIQDEHALKVAITRIEAEVRSLNDRGVKLYTRHGFKIEGTRTKAAKINGEFQNEYFIAKILDDPNLNWKPPILETNRLILRPIDLSDAESIFEYAKNPNVSKYTLWETHQSIKDSQNYIKDYIFTYYREGVPEPLGITLKSNPNKVIGTVGCFWISKKAKSMELAYAIAEDQWGKGITAEASKAVIDYCFKEFSLKRIQARCKSENKADPTPLLIPHTSRSFTSQVQSV